MSPAAFKSRRRSMECWLLLCRWPPQEAVQHVRLQCVPALHWALDARFTMDQWSTLTPPTALDAIGKLVLRPYTQAVQWAEFFGVRQEQECVSEYITKCTQKATDCAFKCQQRSTDLSEYLSLRKLMGVLRDVTLRQQVYQACDSIGSVDALRAMCCAHEAARRDTTGGGGPGREAARAAGTAQSEETECEEE
ncbi:uncharacterized protein LOC126991108 [Eriocheir sinensis]|uniref:uncharacterized protein LOC126991108 n=1 Tax=Eriocheir sinensis TaxID=95602 RepID=UPI0021CA946C|nr:uncharacterized protein LOC126991108 [Eriocheir sinensis]